MGEVEERAVEKHISMLEAKNEELQQEVGLEEKKKVIKEMKASYGKDWKKVVWGAIKSLKINKENLQTLHSMGGNSSLRELNDPRQFGSKSRRLFEE